VEGGGRGSDGRGLGELELDRNREQRHVIDTFVDQSRVASRRLSNEGLGKALVYRGGRAGERSGEET